MAAVRILNGYLREVWTENVTVSGTVTVTTGITEKGPAAGFLSFMRATVSVTSKIGDPVVTAPSFTVVGGVVVVAFVVTGGQITYSLEVWEVLSPQQARDTANNGTGIVLDVTGTSVPVPVTTLETIYVRTGGNDGNDGRTVATAYATPQKAWSDIEKRGRVYNDILIDNGPGTFAGNVTCEGVQLAGGARIYWIGAIPATALRTSTSAGAAAFVASPRAQGLYRLSPDAAWDVAPVAGDIGRTLRIQSATGQTVYATIANISTGNVPGADCYLDLSVNPALVAAPGGIAWLTAAGTTYAILNEAAADATLITGSIYLGNISTVAGSIYQTSPIINKHNCIGHIRFTTGTVTLENVALCAFHGSRFENGLTVTGTCNTSSHTAAVSNAAAWYWPNSIWVRLGYVDAAGASIAGTVNGWGGMGFYISAAYLYGMLAYYSGLVSAGRVNVGSTMNANFIACSFGDTAAFSLGISLGMAQSSYCRYTGKVLVQQNAFMLFNSRQSWGLRGLAVNDTVAASAVDLTGPMIEIERQGRVYVNLTNAAYIDGAQTNAHATNYAVGMNYETVLGWYGGHSAAFYAHAGWLNTEGAATIYMAGDRHFPGKTPLAAIHDIALRNGSILVSIDNWTKDAADGGGVLCGFISLEAGSKWIHGNPNADTGQFVWGATGVGNGLASGAYPIVTADEDCTVVIGEPRINKNDAGAVAIGMYHRSHLNMGGSAASFVEVQGVNVNAIQLGGAAAINGWVPTGAPIGLSDDVGAALGTRQCCTMSAE